MAGDGAEREPEVDRQREFLTAPATASGITCGAWSVLSRPAVTVLFDPRNPAAGSFQQGQDGMQVSCQ